MVSKKTKVSFQWFLLSLALAFSAFADGTVIVEDPNYVHFTELPSGDVYLKTYRASADDIVGYAKFTGLKDAGLKDNPRAPHCTRAEFHVLQRWVTNELYPTVNKTLREVRKGMVDGVKVAPKWENVILMVSSAANCAPQFEGEVVRGEYTPDEVLAEYQQNNFILMRAFTSTTKGKNIADTTPWKSKIHIERASGADVDILGISEWPQEREVLVRPGTVFRVMEREPVEGSLLARWIFSFDQF